MIEITRIGENTTHDSSFERNRPNGHPVYLLLFTKTPARFLYNGTWQVTPPNTAVLFKPGQQHRYCAEGDRYIDDWMHIRSTSPLPGEHFPYGCPIVLHKPEEYSSLFHLIYTEYYGVSPHRSQILNSLTNALLAKLSAESNLQEFPSIYYDLTELREQIYKHPSNTWNVDDMATHLNISTGYLHALYKHYFNTTCTGDVIQSRIQYACDLLMSNHKPIAEIAEICGYHSVEHFCRQFKTIMGISPGKYRGQCNAKSEDGTMPKF